MPLQDANPTPSFGGFGLRRLWRKRVADTEQVSNIHTPLVMGLALVPALGGAAYLASPPPVAQ